MLPNMYIWGSDSAHFRRGASEKFWGFEIVFHWSNLAKLAFYPDKCDKMCDICRRISGNYVHGFFYRVPKCSKICSFLSLSSKIGFHG